MKKQRVVFEFEGKTYYSSKGAADRWDMSNNEITKACREGRIIGAFKDSSDRWCIPHTSIRPLSLDTIKKVLILTLSLKNKPNTDISALRSYDMLTLYKYLRDSGYVENFDENSNRIPYEATLTNKGMDLVFRDKKTTLDFSNIVGIIQCLPAVFEIGALLLHQ